MVIPYNNEMTLLRATKTKHYNCNMSKNYLH